MPHRLFGLAEEVMGHRPFNKPVYLRLNSIGTYQASSAWEACEYLDLHWPAARTARYRRAKSLCQAAIDGLVSAELARRAVVDAAQRAGLLAHGWKMDPDRTKSVFRAVNQRLYAPPAPEAQHSP
jgi:hypothetical protein